MSAQTPALRTLATLPQSFEPNRGQADPAIGFTSHGPGYALSLTPDSALLQLYPAGGPASSKKTSAVRLRLIGGNPDAPGEAVDPRGGKSNYLLGNDSKLWQTDIPQYGRVQYHGVYPGIDITYYGSNQRLEYDFILAPHADPTSIRLAMEGADRVRIDPSGDLVLTVGTSDIRIRKPTIYQESANGRIPVEGHYAALDGNQIGFQVSPYDAEKPLVIDPVLLFSTFFGGTGADYSYSVALDASGNMYLSGATGSPNLHGTDIGNPTYTNSDTAAFVAKISPAGALIFSTFIAGTSDQAGANSVAVDLNGNVYLAGNTSSATFPTAHPLQASYKGGVDVFALELNPTGNALVYSTYLGGSALDYATAIAVDASGNTYVAGATASSNFPVLNATQPKLAGTLNSFAVKIAPGGSSFVYSTYFGGGSVDYSNGMTIDANGDMIPFGDTSSTNFPVLNAFQPNFCGWTTGQKVTNNHGWVAMLNPSGVPMFSTYICGSVAGDTVRGAMADSTGNVVLTGETSSLTFPTLNPIQAQFGGGTFDSYVMKLSPSGTLVYSTYLGGSAEDKGRSVAIDQVGNVYITGDTYSANFPVVKAVQGHSGGGSDAFVTKINAAGSAIVFSTYLGGSGTDTGFDIRVDGLAKAYVSGSTASANFPTAAPLQATYGGGAGDAFLAVMSTCDFTFSASPTFAIAGGPGTTSVTTTGECAWTATSNASWITISTSPASGSGSGSIAFTVAPNGGSPRTGTLTIGGQTVTLTQAGVPVLSITSAHTGNFTQGQNGAAYTLTVANASTAGPTSGTVTVTETFPTGLTLNSMSGSGWTCSTNTCTRADVLAAGASYPMIAVAVNVASNAPSPLTNQVSVSGGSTSSPVTATDTTTIVALAPVLTIASMHTGNFTQGQAGSYLVTVGNSASGGSTSGTVSMVETLPTGLTLSSMSGSGWTCTGSTCTRSDTLAPGLSYPAITVSVNVAANAPSSVTNQVSVSGGGASSPATATDPTTVVPLPAVLSIASMHIGNFTQGQTGSYTLTVTNGVSSGATSGTVTVTETLPSGLTLNSIAGTGWSCSANTCSRADALAPGASYPAISVSVNVAANAPASVTNQVSVSGGGASSPATATDPTTIVPLPAVLSITSTHTGNFTQGQTGAYTLTVTNGTSSGATSGTVTVTETLPSGLTLNSIAGTGWSCSANTCSRADALAPGASYPAISVSVNVAANAPASVTNQVSVSGGGASSPASATDPTTIGSMPPVLSITSTHTGSFTQGQNGALYTLTISSGAAGGTTSGTVTVTETLPAGLTLASISGTGWSCAASSCSRSDALPPGSQYAAITVSVNVDPAAPASVTNQVSVSGGGAATATGTDVTTINPQSVSTLSVTNQGPAAIAFTGLTIGGVSATGVSQTTNCPVSPASLGVSANCTVTLTYTPSGAPGGGAANTTAAGAHPMITQRGVLSASTVAFSAQPLNSIGETRNVTLTNTSAEALPLAGIAVVGSHAADFTQTSSCGSSLAPGAQCNISVVFRPNGAGARKASLAIIGTDPGSAWSMSLAGSGPSN